MENFLNFKAVAIATDEDLTTYIQGLGSGELGVVLNNAPYTGVAPSTIDTVQFFLKGERTGKIRAYVPIKGYTIQKANYTQYAADVLDVQRVGKAATGEGLVVEADGEASIVIENKSYNKGTASQRVYCSLYKRTGETPTAFMNRFITLLQANLASQGHQFATASLLTSGTEFAIQITTTDRNADVQIGMGGMFEYAVVTTTTERVIGIGVGEDVAVMEMDMTRHLGNHGYEKLTDLWYNEKINTDPTKNYDMCTLMWRGEATVGSSTMNVANNTLSFAIDTTLTAQVTNMIELMNILTGVVIEEEVVDGQG